MGKTAGRGPARLFHFLRQFESSVFEVANSVERVILRVFLLAYFLYHLLRR